MPAKSIRWPGLPGTAGSSRASSTMPTAISGTLSRNAEPHQKVSSSQPPTTGPSGMPIAMAAAHTAIARLRSLPGNSTVSTDMDIGTMAAPPTPNSARAAMSIAADPAKAQASDARPNSASAPIRTFFGPIRSPSSPAGSRPAASTSV